ncbi:hypothetical protein DM43_3065 [Burkholderia cepacia]|uniref:Uncharacterized protein n=1 Tax=Burkholderia cepacia TaxID=292 RepID=A0AA88Z0Y1_BURCE|nr:hypothetical protein DM43_3065 [Burkholderia cepacia]
MHFWILVEALQDPIHRVLKFRIVSNGDAEFARHQHFNGHAHKLTLIVDTGHTQFGDPVPNCIAHPW